MINIAKKENITAMRMNTAIRRFLASSVRASFANLIKLDAITMSITPPSATASKVFMLRDSQIGPLTAMSAFHPKRT